MFSEILSHITIPFGGFLLTCQSCPQSFTATTGEPILTTFCQKRGPTMSKNITRKGKGKVAAKFPLTYLAAVGQSKAMDCGRG